MATEKTATAQNPEPPDPAKVVRTAKALRRKCAEHSRNNFEFFVEWVIRDDQGDNIVLDEIHKEGFAFIRWCGENSLFPVIRAPWGSGKTTNYVIPTALNAIGKDPNVRIGIYSNEEGLASARVGAILHYLESSREFKEAYPKIKPNLNVWGNHAFQVLRKSGDPTPTCQSKGILGAKPGPRFDLIICDDITDFENSVYSAAKRKTVSDRLHNIVVGRLTPNGNLLIAATAWHSQDAVERLRKDDRFAVLDQAVTDDCSAIEQINHTTGEKKILPLPKTLSREKLLKEKMNQPRVFARGRQQKGFTEEEKTFDAAAVEAAVLSGPEAVAPANLIKAFGVDLSGDARAGNAVAEAGRDEGSEEVFVLDMKLMKATAPEVCGWIAERWKAVKPESVVVENNGYQQSFIEWAEETKLPTIPWKSHTTGRNKADLKNGLPGLSAAIVSGGIKFLMPQRPESCRKEICECTSGVCKLVKDLKAHPFGDDDSIMALWFAWRELRTGSAAASSYSEDEGGNSGIRRVYSPRENLSAVRSRRRRMI